MIPRSRNEPVSDFLLKLSKNIRKVEAKSWRVLRDVSDEFIKQFSSFCDEIKEKAEETAEEVKEKAEEVKDKVEAKAGNLRKNPGESFAEFLTRVSGGKIKVYYIPEGEPVDFDGIIEELFERNDGDYDDHAGDYEDGAEPDDSIFFRFIKEYESKIKDEESVFMKLADLEQEDAVNNWTQKINEEPIVRKESDGEETSEEETVFTIEEEIHPKISETFDILKKLSDDGEQPFITLKTVDMELKNKMVEVAKESGANVLNLSSSTALTLNTSTFLKDSKTSLNLLVEDLKKAGDDGGDTIVFVDANEGTPAGLTSIVNIILKDDSLKKISIVVIVEDEGKISSALKAKSTIISV